MEAIMPWPPEYAEPSAPSSSRVQLFAPKATAALGAGIAHQLGWPLTSLEERDFEDGEHKIRPLEVVANAEVFVVQSLNGDARASANDKLCKLLFFIGALKDAGAARVTAVVPYLCYARKDRRTQLYDPVTTRYVARLFEAVGVDTVLALDVHNVVAFENAFHQRTVSLTAAPLFVQFAQRLEAQKLCVISPDPGGTKRAEFFREALEGAMNTPIGKGLADKQRAGGIVSGDLFVGDVDGATALIIDDLVSTGTTLLRAARSARRAGARHVMALVTHVLLKPGAEVLDDPLIDRFVVTDSCELSQGLRAHPKIGVLPIAPLLAAAIRKVHEGRSLADLLVR
jgi:ribose-phosphate pyrophosphokinase